MVRLIAAGGPDLVCLQEVPVWALERLGEWSGMTAVGDVAARPRLGPLLDVEKVITDLHHGLLRSALTGQANAVLVNPAFTVVEHRRVVLNPFRFRRAQARSLGLGRSGRLTWAVERRVCQAVRIRRGEDTLVVGNLHATSYSADKRPADAELLRAAVFVDGVALPQEPVLLCGDFNLSVRASHTLAELMTSEWGFSGATPTGIDHVLARGLRTSGARVWPVGRRLHGGHVLSDHAPVEVEVE
jgi:endonuclease/exonuclease/phosphatase family metal-dependent hydrolase